MLFKIKTESTGVLFFEMYCIAQDIRACRQVHTFFFGLDVSHSNLQFVPFPPPLSLLFYDLFLPVQGTLSVSVMSLRMQLYYSFFSFHTFASLPYQDAITIFLCLFFSSSFYKYVDLFASKYHFIRHD
jgi:hypothetical protein